MASEEARQYFICKGLVFSEITKGDIYVLYGFIQKRFECIRSSMKMNKKIRMRLSNCGTFLYAYLTVDGSYFKERECISFNKDGFIGFAGWASSENAEQIIVGFKKWCDYLAEVSCYD